MKGTLATPVCAAVAAFLVVAAPAPRAAVITDGNYVFTRAELRAGSGSASGSDAIDVDAASADTGERELINASWSAAGRAWASNTGGPSLSARSSSSAPPAGGFFAPSSSTNVRSAFRDVLVPDAAGAPAQLSFNFSVHAELMVSQTTRGSLDAHNSHAIVSARALQEVIGFQNALLGNGLSAAVRSFNGTPTTAMATTAAGAPPWNTANFTLLDTNHYEFNGTFSFVADLLMFPPSVIDLPFGAYFIGVGLGTQTSNVGGTSMVDATSTLNLVSITLPGGGALPTGVNFAFESGAPLTVVPLPPALLLFLGALALLPRRKA